MKIKRIGVITSGGDAPGMNSYLFYLWQQAKLNNYELIFFKNAFWGLVNNEQIVLNQQTIKELIFKPGTVIFSKRFKDFKEERWINQAIENLNKNGIDLLIVIGGNGSAKATQCLINKSIKAIFIPASIDNDVYGSEYSLGFDSALNSIIDEGKKLITSTTSHGNVILIEVMGRGTNHLLYHSAINLGAQYIISKKQKLTANEIADVIKKLKSHGREQITIVVSETIYSSLKLLAKKIQQITKLDIKNSILGHTQRGNYSSSYDNLIANELAKQTLLQINQNNFNIGFIIYKNTLQILELKELLKTKNTSSKYEEKISEFNQEQLNIQWKE